MSFKKLALNSVKILSILIGTLLYTQNSQSEALRVDHVVVEAITDHAEV